MKKLKAFEVKYVSPSNTRGSKVQIKDILKNVRKSFDYDYNFNYTLDIAIAIFKKNNINIVGITEMKESYLILTDDFNTNLKEFKGL